MVQEGEGKKISRTYRTRRPEDGEGYTWKPIRNLWKRSQITGWQKVATGEPGLPETVTDPDGKKIPLSKEPPPVMAGVTVFQLEKSRKKGLPITFVDKSAPDN